MESWIEVAAKAPSGEKRKRWRTEEACRAKWSRLELLAGHVGLLMAAPFLRPVAVASSSSRYSSSLRWFRHRRNSHPLRDGDDDGGGGHVLDGGGGGGGVVGNDVIRHLLFLPSCPASSLRVYFAIGECGGYELTKWMWMAAARRSAL